MRYSLKYTLLTWALFLSAATAIPINVPDEYPTIQAALMAADSSDTVLVQPGTYYENIFWPDVNGIKLISAGDSSNTIIDGGANSSVIYMNPSTATIDSTTEIQGFKITNGGNVTNGGGMFISNASPVLTQLWVTGNSASNRGGGLYLSGSPTLMYVNVTGNTASWGGGGLYIDSGNPTLTRVIVTGNTAESGGGLCIRGGSPTLTDVTVTGNTAGSGGGLLVSGSATLTHVTVTGNTAGSNGGGLLIGGFSSPMLMDVTVTGNTAGSSGGGLCISSGSPILMEVIVTDNTASFYGGGLYIFLSSPTLTDGTVSGNTASKGGGFYIYDSLTLTRVTVSRNLGEGLYFIGGSGALTNVTIIGNTSGIYVGSGTPTIAGSNIAYHGNGLYNADNTNIIDADSVWWGDSSGPYHLLHNPGGLGDSVNAFVDVWPWLMEPDTAAPPIPIQNLTIDSTGDDFVELSWDASPIGDLAGYKIYFDTDSSGFPFADTIDVGNNTSYTLSGLEPGLAYFIATTCYDTDGNESWYSNEVSATPTALAVEESPGIPASFALHQAYPNPFNPSTTIRFELPEQMETVLLIHNILGQEVIRLIDRQVEAGYQQVVWNGRDTFGRQVPSGIYIARLLAPTYTRSIKLVLLK